jgi:hypothetical protein
VVQDGDDGITVAFPAKRFPEIAKLMKPRRRRQLSPERRSKQVEQLAKFRFRPAVRVPENERKSTIGIAAGI